MFTLLHSHIPNTVVVTNLVTAYPCNNVFFDLLDSFFTEMVANLVQGASLEISGNLLILHGCNILSQWTSVARRNVLHRLPLLRIQTSLFMLHLFSRFHY